jgi:hypothetical protein
MKTYATVLAALGALLLSTSAMGAPSNNQWSLSDQAGDQGNRFGGDQDRDQQLKLLGQDMDGILHNKHCEFDNDNGQGDDRDAGRDDRNGWGDDRDDHGDHGDHGRHRERCHHLGHPATP